MKKKTISFFMAVVMVLSVVVTGMSQSFTATTQAATMNLKDYSSEEVFRGLMFAQGDVAKAIPALYPADDPELHETINSEEATEAVDKLMAEVVKAEPSFFDSLKDAVHGGNPHIISQHLEQGTHLLYDALVELGYDINVIAGDGEGQGLCWAVGPAFAFAAFAIAISAAAVTHTVAAGVNVYLGAVYLQYGAISNIEPSNEDLLAQEQLIKEIALAFK